MKIPTTTLPAIAPAGSLLVCTLVLTWKSTTIAEDNNQMIQFQIEDHKRCKNLKTNN